MRRLSRTAWRTMCRTAQWHKRMLRALVQHAPAVFTELLARNCPSIRSWCSTTGIAAAAALTTPGPTMARAMLDHRCLGTHSDTCLSSGKLGCCCLQEDGVSNRSRCRALRVYLGFAGLGQRMDGVPLWRWWLAPDINDKPDPERWFGLHPRTRRDRPCQQLRRRHHRPAVPML